ncbi:hypothetical protein [Dyadobacter luticola]|uniref:Uncharacterized protein n=1 Tax=Dyadobacter luticola TaxID=1979387 RepID=A0A5R9L3F8_9BACT|nr:hypothetical protein [Dyadobacter luticola]TLV02825.1 hypothetical protein FEN17_04185 [Dyadobacter luticola]
MEVKARKKKKPSKFRTETVTLLTTFFSGIVYQFPDRFPREIFSFLAAPLSYVLQFIWIRLYSFLDLKLVTYKLNLYIHELECEKRILGKSKTRQLEIDQEIAEYRRTLKRKRIENLDLDG